MSTSGDWRKYPPLTEDQRQAARLHAQHRVKREMGAAPQPDDFKQRALSKYPATLQRATSWLIAISLSFALFVSATRVIEAARQEAVAAGYSSLLAVFIAIAVFGMSEGTLAVALLAARVLMDGKKIAVFLYGIAVLAALLAVVSNAVIVRPVFVLDWHAMLTVIGTFGPPLFVIGMVLSLEPLVLDALAQRQEARNAYEVAYSKWRQTQAHPDQAQSFDRHYRAALKDALIDANKHRAGGKRAMGMLSPTDWQYMVARELAADSALDDIDALVKKFVSERTGAAQGSDMEATPEANPTKPPARRSMQLAITPRKAD